MKQLLLILTCAILFFSCKKDNATNNLYKKWQWQNSVGGFSGHDSIAPSLDSTVILNLMSDMIYNVQLNGQIKASGTFQTSTIDNQKVIKLNNYSPVNKLYIQNQGATYTIIDNKLQLKDYNISEPYIHYFR
ncbi:MAG: hypothetical protein SGJ10_02575 [Bacteroidota bacterium]|nr:hypothetical protein [Bacteroidota bacterium]